MAVQEFLALQDEGLSRRKLLKFLKKYEDRESNLVKSLKLCVRLAMTPPPEVVDEVEAMIGQRARTNDDKR